MKLYFFRFVSICDYLTVGSSEGQETRNGYHLFAKKIWNLLQIELELHYTDIFLFLWF